MADSGAPVELSQDSTTRVSVDRQCCTVAAKDWTILQDNELAVAHTTTLASSAAFEASIDSTPLLDPGTAFKMPEEIVTSSPSLDDGPLKNKEAILAFADTYSPELAADRFGVARSTIRAWMKSENMPLKPMFNSPGQGRKITYPKELDLKIADWVRGEVAKGDRVTVHDVCQYARGVVRQENPDFAASTGWAQRFLLRHNIDLNSQVRSEICIAVQKCIIYTTHALFVCR